MPSGKSSPSFPPSNFGTSAAEVTFPTTPRAESPVNTPSSMDSGMLSTLVRTTQVVCIKPYLWQFVFYVLTLHSLLLFVLFLSNAVLDLYDPFGFNKNMSDETKERRLVAEINNGRLAMLGIFGFLSADKVPGAVPALDALGVSSPYSGDPMIPFEGQFSYLS